ncbi:hypothetical protein KY358_04485 [Candidatus Woesearchaeota archaeon]|nr:hypothetical protein [Candidatus Woesearchaeota archaeon]
MAEEKKSRATKIKKKKWIQIMSPSLFGNEMVGEIPVMDSSSLVDRSITVNLMSLTRDIKKQNTRIRIFVSGVKGDQAITQLYGYYLNPTSIRRLVRRGKKKVSFSVTCKTSDGKKVRVMALLVPYSYIKGSVAASLKKSALSYLNAYSSKTKFEDMIKDLIMNKLQRDMKTALKKVYPIRILEIAKLHLEKEKKPLEGKAEIEPVAKEDEPEQEEKEAPEEAPEEKKKEEKPAKEEKAVTKEDAPKEEKGGPEEKPKQEAKN